MDAESSLPIDAGSREALDALKAEAASASRRRAGERPRWQAIAKFVVVFALAGGAVAWALMSNESPFIYSVMMTEVAANPAAFEGRTLRVEGPLRDGSIQFRQDPCEYRFVLAEGERSLNVRFPQCIVPDTFREGMGISVVVEGRLEEDGSFLASQVIPRCPSRYEMDERQHHGEAIPHAMPAS